MNNCLVIGGGAIGLSLAYELARHGVEVAVIDRGDLGRQSSWAGAGILPPSNPETAESGYEQLAAMSAHLHRQWADELRAATGIDNGYRPCGAVYLARSATDAASLETQMANWQRRRIACERLSESQLAAREPGLQRAARDRPIESAWFVPGESQLRNPRHVRALIVACEQLGVQLRPHVECHDFRLRGGRIEAALTTSGDLLADAFCITAGAWTDGVVERLGLRLPIKPIRGQIVLLRGEVQVLRHVVNDGPRYLVPRDDRRVLIGSTEEDVGFAPHTTAEGVGELLRFGLSLCPALASAAVETSWAGLRPASADGVPFLGRIPGVENAYCAAGHFRSGLELSPGTAVVMSRMMRGEEPGVEMDAFNPGRRL